MTTSTPIEEIILAQFKQLDLKAKTALYKSICESLEKDEQSPADTPFR